MSTGTAILLVAIIAICAAICVVSLRILWLTARARKLIAELRELQLKDKKP